MDYRELRAGVERKVNAHDPIGLLAGGAPNDEYAAEISLIVVALVRSSSMDQFHAAIYEIFVRQFGEQTAGDLAAYRSLASRLWQLKTQG